MTDRSADALAQLESEIRHGPDRDGYRDARRFLREWLFEQANAEADGSIGDAIALLSRTASPSPIAACVVLRCLGVQDLLPAGSESSNGRRICDLVEASAPAFVEFYKIDHKAQTYEKVQSLERIHPWVCETLAPISAPYVGIESFLSARGAILSCLNHNIIKTYGRGFGLAQVRGAIEAVLAKVKNVYKESPSLLVDVEEARKAISDGHQIGRDVGSFLYYDFLKHFLDSAEGALGAFLDSARGKFNTEIVRYNRDGSEIQKRYPLHETERVVEVRFPFRNLGPGLAVSVRVTVSSESESVLFSGNEMLLGNVMPGDFSVSVDAMVISPCESVDVLLLMEWGEIGSTKRKSEIFDFRVFAQRSNVNWSELEYANPYSTEPAEGDKFVGRVELVRTLASKVLRNPMEPFYITGQKRVGKTSLAIACLDSAVTKDQTGSIEYKYILWGAIANEDSRASIRELGESMSGFIYEHLPAGFNHPEREYQGSLSPLLKLADLVYGVVPGKKFVFIIDEFDEIHPELYLQGNLAETFFANIRAISAAKNVSLVLVGGENMPFIMDRQGQKLNKFTRTNLSYFSRDTEWEDYKELVRRPVSEVISWHDDAISEIFNITNGNPYFTNILCSAVLRNAIAERDSDVTSREVKDAIGALVSELDANSFIHLWQDGIFKPNREREPEILRRGRVLVAIARCLRAKKRVTLTNIAEHKGPGLLNDAEIPSVLNDFVRRDVMYEDDGVYSFRLPLFQLWLVDVGMARLVADSLSEELAVAIQTEEEAARVKSAEVVELTKRWPTYRGTHVTAEDVRAWLEQVESSRDQRILFKLLSSLKFLGEADIRERLRSAHSSIRKMLPDFVIRKRGEQRSDVLITYVDGEGKSGQYYASTYAEENRISVKNILSPVEFSRELRGRMRRDENPSAILIVDDIAATGDTLADKVVEFLRANGEAIRESKSKIIVVPLLATRRAVERIEKATKDIADVEIAIRVGELLDFRAFAFDSESKIWSSGDERDRARALCLDIGTMLDPRRPLGYGNLGMLVVFPSTTPNNSLPILYAATKMGANRRWRPLFPRISN